jgi:glycosyltransferase involved in cell wall biosynthesis
LITPLEPIWLTSVLARRRPRVYFSPGFNVTPWSPVPIVFTIHDLIHVHVAAERSATKDAYYRLVVRPAARRAGRVLTGSAFSKREVLDWTGLPEERVVAVGYGVDTAFRPDGPSFAPGFPYLLYVGNSKPHKNLVRLVEAYGRSGLVGQLRLLMTGDPDETLARRIRDLRLETDVLHRGHVSDADLPALYRGAAAVAVPSLYEGLGLPALEALASGVPLFAARIRALEEAAGEAAVLVDPLNVEEMADGLRRVVGDDALRARLVRLGLERVPRFNWERTAALTNRALEEAMSP